VFHGNYTIEGQLETNKVESPMAAPLVTETVEEMKARINKRFNVMNIMTNGIINKTIRSLIISGAPGIGKTYTLNRDLEQADADGEIEYSIVNGKMSPIGLYCKLYECKESNSVLVLDDVDVFSSEDALNVLKAALDTSETRKVCWSTSSSYLKDEGIPTEFEFEGTIVFITNVDMDREIARGSKLAPHLDALLSRSVYLDLGVHTNEEIMVRVEDVIMNTTMMEKAGLTAAETSEVLEWMKANVKRLRNVSLRTALYLASFVTTDRQGWQEIAEVTQLR
jgi:replication-associated recombination protein RarA